jgi:uncharacterized protein
MAVSSYKHGVTWRDVPTSIVAPVTADSGIPFICGASPVFQSSGEIYVNKPRVYLSYEEAVAEMGYSDDWRSYPVSMALYVYFALFNTGPIVVNNILDPKQPFFFGEGPSAPGDPYTFRNGVAAYISQALDTDSVVVTSEADSTVLVEGVDWVGAWQEDPSDGVLRYTISAVPGGAIPTDTDYNALIMFQPLNPKPGQLKTQVIGGVNTETGASTGLETVEDVFPLYGIVLGVLQAPFYTQDPEVAAVISAKADDINGCFRCITLCDIDSEVVTKAIDVKAWKDTNNYTENRMGACWPRVGLVDRDIWLSVELGARIEKTDIDNGNIPVETPSNKLLKMNRTLAGLYGKGNNKDVIFSKAYGDMLNGQGILTAINWIGGWKAWGSNMACYPFITDPKDRWMPARRMTDYVGNSLVLTIFQFVDRPTNRRLIDQVTDTTNVWLNSLVSSGNSLGARVEFRHDENPDTEMIDGHYRFHVYEFFPLPAEWIEFLLELDISYLSVLFSE